MITMEMQTARERRSAAAAKYRPAHVRLLLVAEAPPRDESRYFYFEDVAEHDSLFRYVVRGVLGVEPTRSNKAELLARLRDAGVFLIDLSEEPVVSGEALGVHVESLTSRCKEIDPDAIVLIKATVCDAAYGPLKRAGLPVSSERVPFPGSGRQREFEQAFARALEGIGWN